MIISTVYYTWRRQSDFRAATAHLHKILKEKSMRIDRTTRAFVSFSWSLSRTIPSLEMNLQKNVRSLRIFFFFFLYKIAIIFPIISGNTIINDVTSREMRLLNFTNCHGITCCVNNSRNELIRRECIIRWYHAVTRTCATLARFYLFQREI